MNVNISNELNFSNVYQSVNYNGLRAKFTCLGFIQMGREQSLHEPLWGSFTLHGTQCSLHFDKPQKNEIPSLNTHFICFTGCMFSPAGHSSGV